MKLYTKLSLPIYFGITVMLLGVGFIIEFITMYYPIVKGIIVSSIQKTLQSNNQHTRLSMG